MLAINTPPSKTVGTSTNNHPTTTQQQPPNNNYLITYD